MTDYRAVSVLCTFIFNCEPNRESQKKEKTERLYQFKKVFERFKINTLNGILPNLKEKKISRDFLYFTRDKKIDLENLVLAFD